MLTTLDNPFNPFGDFDRWYAFDVALGYNSCAYLSRITHSSPELSVNEENALLVESINAIVSMNITGNYIKVTRESWAKRLGQLKELA